VTNIVNPSDGVAADDRLEGEFEEQDIDEAITGLERRGLAVLGGRPTAAALERLWAERDQLYADNQYPLEEEDIRRVRAFRTLEVRSLAPKEQVGTNLATRAMTWRPPR